MSKRSRYSQQYSRRMTKAYQQNVYQQEHKGEGMSKKEQKRERIVTFVILGIIVACIVLSILFGNMTTNIIGLVVLGAFVVIVFLRGNRKQNKYLMGLMDDGIKKKDFLKMLKVRNTKESQMDAMAKAWDRAYKKRQKKMNKEAAN
ncbi:MAG: hypothetical protein ACOX4I_06380 [Anaerovoracaceae bacterium]|jgi:hypothetical protein